MQVNNNYMANAIKGYYNAGGVARDKQGDESAAIADMQQSTQAAYKLDLQEYTGDVDDVLGTANCKVDGIKDTGKVITEGLEIHNELLERTGEEWLADMMQFDRMMQARGWKKGESNSKAMLGKYYDSLSNIKSGKTSFDDYNLELAALALAANDKTSAKRLNQHLEAGHFTMSDYEKASSFATKLQNALGVYVEVDLGKSYENSNTSINYSYNDSLVRIGITELDFMADNDEAMGVWKNVVRGKYSSHADIIKALKNQGFSDIADRYEKNIIDTCYDPTSNDAINSVLNNKFTHETGKLWESTACYVGLRLNTEGNPKSPTDESIYRDLKKELNIDNRSTYAPIALLEARNKATSSIAALWHAVNEYSPRNWVQNAKGYWIEIDA